MLSNNKRKKDNKKSRWILKICACHNPWSFINIQHYNSQVVLPSLSYTWKNWGSKSLNNLLKITYIGNGRGQDQT